MTAALPDRPRVLHLAYEDPRRPGAGGGSVRTRRINAELARDFDVTVVTATYPGARPRVEDGVRWVHVGVHLGRFGSLLTYFLFLPWALWRHRSDLVVEDFGAPFGSVAVPWLTRRPVVGVVQWLFAREKSAQYGLPFHVVEAVGLRSHRRLVAVSEGLADQLRARAPRADVAVVRNGLEPAAFGTPAAGARSGVLYLGRLDVAQKGLDLLIDAWSRAGVDRDLLVAGDGPDEARLRELAGPRVRFLGRVPAAERFALLASAELVVMPSRYETFGMVAAEALAVRTPVLAFDIPCLRELVDGLVPAYDVDAYAAELRRLLADPAELRRRGDAGPARVADLRWDRLAAQQAHVYREALTA